jgi:hypothetical protein
MIGRSRWAKAVALAGTRAMAPPSTRSWATAMGAVEAWSCSTTVAAAAPSKRSRNIERADSSTTSMSSGASNSPAYGMGRTMSAIGSARARNGATARSPASAGPA